MCRFLIRLWPRRQRIRRFILINLLLLLLYGWTLTEETTLTIEVTGEKCTAVLAERSSTIPCPGLKGGSAGLYVRDSLLRGKFDVAPLDWLAPRSAWRSFQLIPASDSDLVVDFQLSSSMSDWQKTAGEWRPREKTAAMVWPVPDRPSYSLKAALRRPYGDAGILLLDDSGQNGWVFIATPQERRGVWWHWQDGGPAQAIVGVPFQKGLLAQTQSLLRRLLRAHQGALLLLLAGWLLAQASRRLPAAWRRRLARPAVATDKLIILAAMMLVLVTTVFIASEILERMPHVQDSVTYLFQAQTLAKGKLWSPAPAVPAAFEQEFLIAQNGRWFGKYPPGYPLVLAVGVLLKQPWLINPLLAVLTIPLLYALGVSLYGKAAARLAVILAAASPFFLFMSSSMMPHAVELFWTTLFMVAWLRANRRDPNRPYADRRWILVTALALGMLFLTREFSALAISVPFVLATSLTTMREKGWTTWRPLASRAVPLLLGMLPFVLLLAGYRYGVTGDPLTDPRLLYWDYDRPGFGQDVGPSNNAMWVSHVSGVQAVTWYTDPEQPANGHFPAQGVYNTEKNFLALQLHLFGWPIMLTLSFLWLAFLLRRPAAADLILLSVMSTVFGAYVFYWAAGIMYGPRYYYIALPALLLLTARGIQAAAGWIGGRAGRWAVALLLAVLILGSGLFYLPPTIETYRGYNFVTAQDRAQVEAAVAGKAIVFAPADSGNWWEYGTYFAGNTPWLDGRILYARDLGDEENGRLMAHYPDYEPYLLRGDVLVRLPAEP